MAAVRHLGFSKLAVLVTWLLLTWHSASYCKVLGDQCKVLVSGLSGEFGSTCVVDGPNTWEATDGHGPGDVRVGWRMIEGLVA